MRIVELMPDGTGIGDIEGIRHRVDLSLLDAPALDDYVIVHAGFAIEKLDQQEANERLALFEELALAERGEPRPG
jgi:hydrogenase expression/formation protein HypC